MQTKLLPPGGRDFEVYRLVMFEEKTTREAASEMGISQTRVCQIVGRVGAFMLEVSPGEEKDPLRVKRLNLAEEIAAERLDHLYRTSLVAFRESKGVKRALREKGAEGVMMVTKESCGEQKFLNSAGRLAMLGGKLPVSTLGSHVRWEEEEFSEPVEGVTVVEVEDDAREVVQLEASSPPVEDCSTANVQTEVASTSVVGNEVANPISVGACVLPALSSDGPNSGNTETVQAPIDPKKLDALRRRQAFLAPLGAP